jgi:ATP-dependent exoDNAse (exonuclease V) beta subunit
LVERLFVKQRDNIERVDSPNGRRYKTPLGDLYPSVTTVLSATADNSWMGALNQEWLKARSEFAATKGTETHLVLESWVRELEEPKVSGYAKSMAGHIKRRIEPHISAFIGSELMMYSDELRIAGSCDCICIWKGKLAILDFKTNHSDAKKNDDAIFGYKKQCCAYSEMFREQYGRQPSIGVLAIATKFACQIVEFENKDYLDALKADISAFEALNP